CWRATRRTWTMPSKEKPEPIKTIGGNARKQLKGLVERIERLDEERRAINEDQKELYAEGKAVGYDTGVLRIVIRRRKKDATEQAAKDALLDLYLHALAAKDDGDEGEPF